MAKRLNFNKEVDDLTKINEFFQTGGHPKAPKLSRPPRSTKSKVSKKGKSNTKH